MSSPSVSLSARPRLHVAPQWAETNGDLAALFATDYGLTPDPWQRLVLDDWLAEDAGRYASLTCGLACARQNGKNAVLEIRELFGMVGRGERILHTAHEVKTARKAFKRLLHFFGREVGDPGAKFPELNALVTELRHVNGQEAIFLSNGGSVEIVARSKNSGRGFTVDVLVLDEAQELSDDDLEALMPTTSSAPLGNPQWIFTGTPPGPRASGEVFTRTRTEALSDKPGRLCWHEWSAAGESIADMDLDDRALWHSTNPALGGRLQIEVVEGERARFSDEGFARERLGWWRPVDTKTTESPLSGWDLLASARRPMVDPVYGVDVDGDRMGSLVAAWQVDGLVYVEMGQPVPAHELADRVKDVAGSCPVAAPTSLVPDLERVGVRVVDVKAAHWPQACASLIDRVKSQTLRHANQPALNTAVENLPKPKQSSSDAPYFMLRDSQGAGPALALARALHGLTAPRRSAYEDREPITL